MPRNSRRSKGRGYNLPDRHARELLDRLAARRSGLNAFRARANERRTRSERLADDLTRMVGSPIYLIFHVILFAVWIGANMKLIPGLSPYDPFPFGLLTLAMTLEQSLLTIFIIMSQNRNSDISDLRNEIDLQINIIAEEEISKALQMLHHIGEHMGIEEIINDRELLVMEAPLNHSEMEKQTRQELEIANGTTPTEVPVVPPVADVDPGTAALSARPL
jgi:uncharacterized membrane protein